MMEEKLSEYVRLSETYLSNANQLAAQAEWSKAGEMLWGAVAVLVKAVGAAQGKPVASHREVVHLGRFVAREARDPELAAFLKVAERLHANYYENFVSAEDFPMHYGQVLEACRRLRRILAVRLQGAPRPGSAQP